MFFFFCGHTIAAFIKGQVFKFRTNWKDRNYTNNFQDTDWHWSILNSSHPKVLQIDTMGVNGIQNCLVTNTLHKLFYVPQKNKMQTGLEHHETVFSFLGGLSL